MVHFEDGLRDNLKVLIAPQMEQEFSILVDKAKIAKEVKRVKCQREIRVRVVQSPLVLSKGLRNGPDRMGLLKLEFQSLLVWLSRAVTMVGAIQVSARGGWEHVYDVGQ